MIDQTSQLDLITVKDAQGEGMDASINALVSQPMVPLFRTAVRGLKLVLLCVLHHQIFDSHLSGLTYDFGTLAHQTK